MARQLTGIGMSFQDRVRRARQSELLTEEETARRANAAAQASKMATAAAAEESRLALERIWIAVADATRIANPPADDFVATYRGINEAAALQPTGLARWRAWRGKRPTNREVHAHIAMEKEICSRNAQPAWDMFVYIRVPDHGDEGRREFFQHRLFLGRDATMYGSLSKHGYIRSPDGTACPIGDPWRAPYYRPGHDFGVQRAGWDYSPDFARHTYDVVEQGLANLVARHSLRVNV